MTSSIEQWRVFIAIELPGSIREQLMRHIDRLRTSVPEARASWSRAENLHLTLKFLGDVPVTNVEALSKAAQKAALPVAPFDLVVGGCGAFPPKGQPRVLWIGLEDPSAILAGLHRALDRECARIGFAREARPFHPHLTIARLRNPQGSRRLAALHANTEFGPVETTASGLSVIRSELRSEGSRYTVIARHDLPDHTA